jgi:hypothetical protein
MYSKSNISDIQRRIQVKLTGLEVTSELQYVDIMTTSAWIRSLLWQYSASRFMLSSGTSIEPLSFEYPLSIAKEYLDSLSNVSIESLRSHGYGMVSKLLFKWHLKSINHVSNCGYAFTGNKASSSRELCP